jgi:putative membrane protein
MESTRSLKDRVFLVIKGLAMGAANKVPGVSGGVVAFVAGFYEEFIYSLQRVNKTAFKLLISRRYRSFYRYINGKFLGLLFLGMVVSYFSVSKILDYLIENYQLYVWSTFFGMILGSIYYINKDFKDWNRKTITALILGTVVGLSISFLDPATENDNLLFVFFCGMISVSGMTLPGFSGSFILILLGNYVLLLVDSVNALYDTIFELLTGDFTFLENQVRLRMLKVLAVFTLGSVAGLVTFSHILNYILHHYKNITLATIVGFIIGSLGVVWPWKETIYKTNMDGDFVLDSTGKQIIENYQRFLPEFNGETYLAIAYIVLGVLIVLGLEWYGQHTRKVKA